MASIGYGTLPAPASVDSNEYDAWFVPSTGATVADSYYELGLDDDNAPAWLERSAAVLYEQDPVVFINGSVTKLSELASPASVTGSETVFSAQSTWTVNHTLTRTPHVTMIDAAGRRIRAQVDYPTPTQVVATHNAPQSGTMRIS